MLHKSLAVLGLAAVAAVSSPTVALAAPAASAPWSCSGVAGSTYADSGSVTVSDYSVGAGDSVDVSWHAGYFTPGAPVTVVASGVTSTIDGWGTSAVDSLSGTADSSGALSVAVTPSAGSAGSLSVRAMSDSGCGGVSVSVASIDPAAVTDPALASTGGTVPTVLLVSGGGALIFGVILLSSRARTRRGIHD